MDRDRAHVWSPSQAAAQRDAKRRSLFYSYLNLWPFVGVLFALLIIFMTGAPPPHGDSAVDLPNAFHATAQPRAWAEDAMKIYITRDGRVYFRNRRLDVRSLPILIRGVAGGGAEKKVYLAVDARAKYGDAAAVLNEIGKAEIRAICILAYKPEQ